MNIAIIPARLNSTRFPKKILANIKGKPMIAHVAERALESKKLDKVIIAIDSKETKDALEAFDFDVVMTSTKHKSGTDRIAEVAKKFNNDDIIINIQGDEPLLKPKLIDDLIKAFDENEVQMATLASTRLSMEDFQDKNIVKLCVDDNMYARGFFRNLFFDTTINEVGCLYKHIGVYAFRQKCLQKYTSLTPTKNEKHFKLEQLRALENDIKIKVIATNYTKPSVDTLEDLSKIAKILG